MPKISFVPSDGHVILAFEDNYKRVGSIEMPHAKKDKKHAIIVAHGRSDKHEMSEHIQVGAKVLMPHIKRQTFSENGQEFFIVHHLDIKAFYPIEDKELALKLLQNQFDQMPEDVKEVFMDGYSNRYGGVPKSNVK